MTTHKPPNVSARRSMDRIVRAFAVVVRDPVEGVERIREKIADEASRWAKSNSLSPESDWEASLHARLGVEWPCGEVGAFNQLWQSVVQDLEARGLTVGRGSFSGWDDADAGLARAAWCLTRHERPMVVVETGVARGLTTRMVLEALEANHHGHLYSIDLPPPLAHDRLAAETAAAVTENLKWRWTLIRGSSRRRLPRLLHDLGQIDVFIHDSRHTRRNISFELKLAWAALRRGGMILADDIQSTTAFEECVAAFGRPYAVVCTSDDQRGRFGLIRKPG